MQVVGRPQDAADPWFAGRLPGVTGKVHVCSFPVGPVLWVAGRAPGAGGGLPVQEDCTSSELW